MESTNEFGVVNEEKPSTKDINLSTSHIQEGRGFKLIVVDLQNEVVEAVKSLFIYI